MMMPIFLLRSILPLALLFGLTGVAGAVALTPQYAGNFLNGDGVNSQWVQVSSNWVGATSGAGTGIRSLADQAAIMGLHAGDANVVQTLSRRVDQINFADQVFINTWGASWGTPPLAPIFHNVAGENQDDWASRFTGYLSVTTPGNYNLGVLYDDGFRFSLSGANGQTVSMQKDGLNPRDRLGFNENLQLTPGLYAFQLDAYEHLEAGVIQLGWWTPTADFAVIGKQNLYSSAPTSPVPEPSMLFTLLSGLALTVWRTLKRN